MRETFQNVDIESLVGLWNRCLPERYAVDSEVFRLNTVDSPLFDWGASGVEVVDGEPTAFVAVKRSAAGLFSGPDRDQYHLSAAVFCDPLVVQDLLTDTKRLLRNRGATQLVFGQDVRHFFPGCPVDCPALHSFLTIEGFVEGAEVVDLERDLGDYVNPYPAPPNAEMRMLGSSDANSLAEFLHREFPGRWSYDVSDKIQIESIENCVFGLLVDGRVEGFALLQNGLQRALVGGAVWRRDLGESWGSLGPIGISRSLRGHRYGQALLGAALTHLKGLGTRHCIIDWTVLVDFYGKHGFEPTRRYLTMALRLD